MTFKFKNHLRTTTALCIASTIAVAATTAYASGLGGLSNWDKRFHLNRFHKLFAAIENGKNNNGGSKDNDPANKIKTASPIKHVIVLIGENRGLDHTFGVYKPKGKGETISNLLSKGIVNEDGTPGPNFSLAQQYSVGMQPSYYIGASAAAKSPYNATNKMPQPNTNGAPVAQSATGAPFQNTTDRKSVV